MRNVGVIELFSKLIGRIAPRLQYISALNFVEGKLDTNSHNSNYLKMSVAIKNQISLKIARYVSSLSNKRAARFILF